MRVSRRRLEVGADGHADIELLTDPIPRHVSIVKWGANDRPAVSWMSAGMSGIMAHSVLRSPPSGNSANPAMASLDGIKGFLDETIEAWIATVAEVLATALEPGDRAAKVRALTVQAGARAAAMATALGAAGSNAARSYRSVKLEPPAMPSGSTLHGEIDRRMFMATLQEMAAYLIDETLSLMQGGEGSGHSVTESILHTFANVSDLLSEWAGSMPRGTVGVALKSHPVETQMKLTIQDLTELAESNPIGVLNVIKRSFELAKEQDAPKETLRFMWGDTGVEPFSAQQIISTLDGMQDGMALASLIASAVGGVDVDSASGQNVQVAAAMRTAITKHVVASVRSDPTGPLAKAITEALAPQIGEAVAHAIRSVIDGGALPEAAGGEDFMNFQPEDDFDLTADLPGQR